MDEHKKYLADCLLSEERAINYRLLSRALDVHVNTAKEMLYDFYKYQNALRANSIYATYLVYGIKGSDNCLINGDVEMGSSMPEDETFSEEVPTITLSLVGEQDLKAVLSDYNEVNSIHVYSLAPHPQKDLSQLSDMSAQLAEYPQSEDVVVAAKKYGTIFNAQMRRRDRSGRSGSSAVTPSKPTKQEPSATKPTPAAQVKQEPLSSKPTPAAKSNQEPVTALLRDSMPSSSAAKKSTPALKRGVSGGIMQSFARAAAKPAKPTPAGKKEEDTAMALSDDGEAEDADMPAPKKQPADSDAVRKSRKEREDELRRMMEEDEDEESDGKDGLADEEMEEAPEPEPEPEPESEPMKEDKEPAEVVVSSEDGRRRGKRRVMTKKRIMDDQGYMVTIQEPGWESFSEDEAPTAKAPPAKKHALTPTPSSSSKGKKPAGIGSQGNIMSFFSKK